MLTLDYTTAPPHGDYQPDHQPLDRPERRLSLNQPPPPAAPRPAVGNPARSRFTRHPSLSPPAGLFLAPKCPFLQSFLGKFPPFLLLGTPRCCVIVDRSSRSLPFSHFRFVSPVLIRFVPRSYSSLDLPAFYSPSPHHSPLISSSYSFEYCLTD